MAQTQLIAGLDGTVHQLRHDYHTDTVYRYASADGGHTWAVADSIVF
jgi:hypothetical protein